MRGSKKYASSTTSSSVSGGNDSSDLQSWCEVPSIAHFCSLFRQAFDLLEFDIQELEESLLLMNSEDDSSQLVQRLVIKLLKGCSNTFTKNITEDNYNTYLRRLFLSKREDAEEDNLEFHFDCKALLDDDIDFQDLSLRNRVRILHQLCEFRLDAEDVFEKLKNLDASSLRVDPLGKDADGTTYWYFYGTRLYKEEFPKGYSEKKKRKEKERKKKKKEKKKKKKKKSSKGDIHSASSGDEEEAEIVPQSTWSVACLTLQDWEDLTNKYKNSKKKHEKELFETLSESFLPEIVKMFAEKEKEERRRLLLMQPKRTSSRIERKRHEQEERERLLAEKLEEARKLEEQYDEKLRAERAEFELDDRERTREDRLRARETMKELRAQRAMERDLKSAYQKSKYDSDEEERFSTRDPSYQPSKIVSKAVSDDDEEEDEEDSRDSNHWSSSNNERKSSRTNFTNALLRVGTKSTKDSSLDKPVRKGAGLLLEAAGRSLLQKASGSSASQNRGSGGGIGSGEKTALGSSIGSSSNLLSGGATIGGLSFGLASSKISFGLYGGHLPVDHGEYTKPKSKDTSPSRADETSDGESGEAGLRNKTDSMSRQKVFSNWGGEFFKKNLDYRANTNKILEKMNLTKQTSNGSNNENNAQSTGFMAMMKTGGAGSTGRSGTSGGSASAAASGNAKRPFEASEASSSPSKRLKSSFLNTYS